LNQISFVPAGNEGFMDPQKIAALFGIREGMRIADFGCGSGYFTILMAKITGESGHVIAVDVLNSALETVRSKAKNEDLRNISFIRSNLEVAGSSGIEKSSQDLVLLANVLFQSEKKKEIIGEAAGVLKSGGGLAIIGWKKGVGGFGPPDELRNESKLILEMTAGAGFKKVNDIDAGAFHYGFIFRKI
jgi:ubiquinone/menaquinone biosynthesis C-methylase UbiE